VKKEWAKKWGPRLGSGAPEGAFQLLASFSRQRVGSSILASLSEAGGYGPQKVTSKPLPPRLSLFASRHLKRAHGSRQCKISANSRPADNSIKVFYYVGVTSGLLPSGNSKTALLIQFGTPRRSRIGSLAFSMTLTDPAGSRTTNLPELSVFFRIFLRMASCFPCSKPCFRAILRFCGWRALR